MNMADLRKKAKLFGIKAGAMKKSELIMEVQREEGNFPCFGTARDYCDQAACCFREDCIRSNN